MKAKEVRRLCEAAEVEPIHFVEGRLHVIEGCGNSAAGCVGRAIGPNPDVGRVVDLSHVLTEPANRLFPVEGTGSFFKKLDSILREGLVELRSSLLPHMFHRLLPLGAELQPVGSFVERRTQSSDDVVNLRCGKHADTGLHEQIFVKEKHLGADTCFVRGRIVGSGQLAQHVARRSFKAGAQQVGQLATEPEILGLRQALHDPTVAPRRPLCRWR